MTKRCRISGMVRFSDDTMSIRTKKAMEETFPAEDIEVYVDGIIMDKAKLVEKRIELVEVKT